MNTWSKTIIQKRIGSNLYLSVPFTWQMGEARQIALAHKGKVFAGGPAVQLMGCDWAITDEPCPFDPLACHNPLATFTTRGCPNACPFCAVPRIEGEFRELEEWKIAPVVCDNNFLASSRIHIKCVIDSLRDMPYVDFNQGLDARLFNDFHADHLSHLRGVKVRFSLDHSNQIGAVADAVAMARSHGLRDLGVYVLIGYNDTPEDALHRLDFVRSLGIRPNPMRYQPLNATEKNAYVAPGWTDLELKRMTRYYSRLRYLEHVPYTDYQYGDETPNIFETPVAMVPEEVR